MTVGSAPSAIACPMCALVAALYTWRNYPQRNTMPAVVRAGRVATEAGYSLNGAESAEDLYRYVVEIGTNR